MKLQKFKELWINMISQVPMNKYTEFLTYSVGALMFYVPRLNEKDIEDIINVIKDRMKEDGIIFK